MKNGIIFLVVAALVVLILFFSYKIVRNIKAQKRIDELYARPARNKGFVLRVLTAAFGSGKVILNPRIPVKSRQALPPAAADALIVCRAGIIVVTVLPQIGKLDNPQHENWRFLSPNGTIATVENPFGRNSYMIEVLKHILRRDGFHNVSLHSLVIMANCRAVMPRFTYRNMLTEHTMIEEIRNIQLDKQLSFTEMRDVRMTVRRSLITNALQDTANQ